MALIFHRLVQKDLRAVLRYYEEEGGIPLADRFFAELDTVVGQIASEPRKFHFVAPELRRANMPRFPYHLLFREGPTGIRVLVPAPAQRPCSRLFRAGCFRSPWRRWSERLVPHPPGVPDQKRATNTYEDYRRRLPCVDIFGRGFRANTAPAVLPGAHQAIGCSRHRDAKFIKKCA